MNIEEAIQDLQDIGHFLNHRLGTDSYEIRCKIYDIRKMLTEQVEKTVVLADVMGSFDHSIIDRIRNSQSDAEARRYIGTHLQNLP